MNYYENGDKKLPLIKVFVKMLDYSNCYYFKVFVKMLDYSNCYFKVFVAKRHGEPPLIFKTSGYSLGDHKLHFGNVLLEQGDGATALFFVIHPNSWGPYQV